MAKNSIQNRIVQLNINKNVQPVKIQPSAQSCENCGTTGSNSKKCQGGGCGGRK